MIIRGLGDSVTEKSRDEHHADEREPSTAASPFAHPSVMTGYPLSPDEQEHVDRLANREETRGGEQGLMSEKERTPEEPVAPEPPPSQPSESPFPPPEIDKISEGDEAPNEAS
jgi:hypothetical protein